MARDTYAPIKDWKDKPDKTTPIMADDLKHIEQGIKDAMDNRALKEIYEDTAISLGRGQQNKGNKSLAVGFNADATAYYSASIGNQTVASNTTAFAHGDQTTASGTGSHAEGLGAVAKGAYSHAEGKYNVEDSSDKYAHIVGNGRGLSERSNAYTLDWNGNAWFAKDVTTDEVSLAALNSSLLSASVDITDKCRYQVTGQSLEIDVPIDGISLTSYMNRIFGGLYWGIVNFQSRPPHTFIAQISGQYRGQKDTKDQNITDGFANLINDNVSVQEQYGKIFHGTIDLSSVQPASGTAKITFDMTPPQGESTANVGSIQIFKALPINDIMTRLATLEETVAGLSGGGGGTNDYEDLINKPQINTVTLSGDKSLGDLGAANTKSLDELQEELDYVRGGYSQIRILENVRIKDAPNGKNIGTAYVAETYDVITATDEWIKIPYQNGYGYVAAQYTTPYGTQILSNKELSEKVAALEEKIQ